MTGLEFAETYRKLTTEQKNGFLARIKETLSAEDYKAISTFLTLHDWFNDYQKFCAIRKATGEVVYAELTK